MILQARIAWVAAQGKPRASGDDPGAKTNNKKGIQ